MAEELNYFERNIARLLIVLQACGRPVYSLLEGETRQVDSIGELQRFDFWVREPGHLALALLTSPSPDEPLRKVIESLMKDEQADIRRYILPGSPFQILDDFGDYLGYLTSRALLSDRPSFVKSRSYAHQIVLESAGLDVVNRILAECPAFDWYRSQCEIVTTYLPFLEKIDLNTMPYLAPDLTPAQAATLPVMPFIRARFTKLFGVVDAVV